MAPALPPGSHALVLLSGGLDSAVALHWTLRRAARTETLLVHLPAQPAAERRAARAVAAHAGVALVEREAAWLAPPADVARQGFVPQRNLALYAIAANHAARSGATVLVGGHTANDRADFPDAAPAFFRALEPLLAAGAPHDPPLRLVLPFLERTKEDVVALGRALGAPLELTWSCYRRGRRPCGRCQACQERIASMRTPRG